MVDTTGHMTAFFDMADHEHMWKVLAQCDYNLFFQPGSDNPMILKGVPLSDWHRMYRGDEDVYDIHSVTADPMFVDEANGDYSLKPESPALKLGFQPIDTTQIGVRIAMVASQQSLLFTHRK